MCSDDVVIGRIEAWKYDIVAMENMHPLAPGSLYARVESVGWPLIARQAMKGNSPASDVSHHSLGIVFGRTAVDHLDLHHIRAESLRQHALHRPPQERPAIVGGDHHGPEGTSPLCLNLGNRGRSSTQLREAR